MKRKSSKLITLLGMVIALPVQAADYGFPTLNTAGRYFGVGWSHHSYHSHVNGRFNILEQRHPASDYPSRCLSYPYSPYYTSYSANSSLGYAGAYHWAPPSTSNSPTDKQMPTLAPEPPGAAKKKSPDEQNQEKSPENVPSKSSEQKLEQPKKSLPVPKKQSSQRPKPSGPPPDWLKPFLDSELEATPAEVNEDNSELIELQPSPSDNSPPRSAALRPTILNRYKIQ